MILLLILSIIITVISVGINCYIIYKMINLFRKNLEKIIITFIIFLNFMLIWGIGQLGMILSMQDLSASIYWHRYAMFGGAYMAPTMLHFIILYTKVIGEPRTKYLIFLYVPPTISYVNALMSGITMSENLTPTSIGYYSVYQLNRTLGKSIHPFSTCVLLIYIITTIILIAYYYFIKEKSYVKRREIKYVGNGLIFFLMIGMITGIILPAMHIQCMDLAVLGATIFGVSVFIAIRKMYLFSEHVRDAKKTSEMRRVSPISYIFKKKDEKFIKIVNEHLDGNYTCTYISPEGYVPEDIRKSDNLYIYSTSKKRMEDIYDFIGGVIYSMSRGRRHIVVIDDLHNLEKNMITSRENRLNSGDMHAFIDTMLKLSESALEYDSCIVVVSDDIFQKEGEFKMPFFMVPTFNKLLLTSIIESIIRKINRKEDLVRFSRRLINLSEKMKIVKMKIDCAKMSVRIDGNIRNRIELIRNIRIVLTEFSKLMDMNIHTSFKMIEEYSIGLEEIYIPEGGIYILSDFEKRHELLLKYHVLDYYAVCITRDDISYLREQKFHYENVKIYRVSPIKGKNNISQKLEVIREMINDVMRKENAVILMDSFHYLVHIWGFSSVLNFLHLLQDDIIEMESNVRILVAIKKESLDVKEYNTLISDFKVV